MLRCEDVGPERDEDGVGCELGIDVVAESAGDGEGGAGHGFGFGGMRRVCISSLGRWMRHVVLDGWMDEGCCGGFKGM